MAIVVVTDYNQLDLSFFQFLTKENEYTSNNMSNNTSNDMSVKGCDASHCCESHITFSRNPKTESTQHFLVKKLMTQRYDIYHCFAH